MITALILWPKTEIFHFIFFSPPLVETGTLWSLIPQVADSWESMDGWLDAIRLVYTIFARGKSDVLAGIIAG